MNIFATLLQILVGLFAITVYIPFLLPRRILPFCLYTLIVFAAWLLYTIVAVVIDGLLHRDVNGTAYIVVGFLGWVIGLLTFLIRKFINRSRKWRYEIKADNQ